MRNEVNIESLGRPVCNQLFVEIQDIETEFKTKGGIIAKSDFTQESWGDAEGHNVTSFIPRSGKLVAMPETISSYGYDYFTDNELEIGDTVFWTLSSFDQCPVLCCSGKKYLSIDYHKIIMRVRDGVILPINGNVLLTPVSKETKALAYTTTEKITDRWDIYQLPEKMPTSKIARRNGETNWEVGDRVVVLLNHSAPKLEGDINNSIEKDLYYVPLWMCLCSVKKD